MLLELRVNDLLLIESADLELASGLNVLTGETGAGKTLLATALGLLMGDRSRSGLVRPGAAEARVEGIFDVPDGLDEDLADLIGEHTGEVVLARRVWPDGRSRAQIAGRTVSVGDLRRLGERLFSFHGQHEHRRLALSDFQLELLDRAVGEGQLDLRGAMRKQHASLTRLQAQLDALAGTDSSGQREADLLRFEIEEIESLGPSLEDRDALVEERALLAHADAVRLALGGIREGLVPESGDGGLASGAATLAARLAPLCELSPELSAIHDRLQAASIELSDLAGETRTVLDSMDSDPQRLSQVEQRLAEYDRLERKHGGNILSLLAHADAATERLAALSDLEGTLASLEGELSAARGRCEETAVLLSEARTRQAPLLAAKVEAALADIALEGARFSIVLDVGDGIGPSGRDNVEFMIAVNPGLPEAPLADSASGGEMSRVLLALLDCVSSSGEGATTGRLIVFDEIDAGIGGRTARAVADRLSRLAGGIQVLCITHLAQVAAMADRHFRIVKSTASGETKTTIEPVTEELQVDEMVRLLGGSETDTAVRAHALELLSRA